MRDGNKQYVPSVGKFPSPLKMLKFSFLNERRLEFISGKFDSDKTYNVDWVSGAFMLMRKKDYDAVQGFDPDYFLYVEDVDLCKRMADAGKKCIFIPSLSYLHFVGFNKSREIFLIKGYQIYAGKHFFGLSRTIANVMLAINKMIKRRR